MERMVPWSCVKQPHASETSVWVKFQSTSESARNGRYSVKFIWNSVESREEPSERDHDAGR